MQYHNDIYVNIVDYLILNKFQFPDIFTNKLLMYSKQITQKFKCFRYRDFFKHLLFKINNFIS